MSGGRWLVVGLGNPGPEYALTRHNAGYLVVEELARRAGASWRPHRSRRADVVETRLGGPGGVPVVLARPRSYMNEIGGPVAAVSAYYDVPVDRLVAVHDELDLPFGGLRLKRGGGDAGHNGLRSMRRFLGTGDFHRVRIGLGRPSGPQDPADFVLQRFTAAERQQLDDITNRAADAVMVAATEGLERAQQLFNG